MRVNRYHKIHKSIDIIYSEIEFSNIVCKMYEYKHRRIIRMSRVYEILDSLGYHELPYHGLYDITKQTLI